MIKLTQRQKEVLQWIVHHHIETALPVGSKYLGRNSSLGCSTATIRNEMVSLEKMGYIKQPHTSAGRIPTNQGYRLYVDLLMKIKPLKKDEYKRIKRPFEKHKGNVKLILEEASRILGEISSELAVVLTPWISWGIFDRLELIGLSHNKVLSVIHVRSRLVKTVIIEVTSELEHRELEKAASLINERLSGLTLEEIIYTIKERLNGIEIKNKDLLNTFLNSAPDLFNLAEPMDIHTCGTYNIVSQPEFSDSKLLGQILTLVDDRRDLIKLFNKKVNNTEIVIGEENNNDKLKCFTIIRSNYKKGKDVGTLGVIGPMRLRYNRILPLVDCVTETMSYYLS